MSATETAETVVPGFIPIEAGVQAPGVFQEGWLPDVPFFPELVELRETYLRIKAQSGEASSRVYALEQSQAGAKAARIAAAQRAVLLGKEPPPNDDADLAQELERAKDQNRAAGRALVEHINHCIEVVCAHRDEWLMKCDLAEKGIAIEAEALRDQYLAKIREKGSFFKLEHWISRTSGQAADMPSQHLPYSAIPEPTSSDPAEAARELQGHMEKSYAGSQTRSD